MKHALTQLALILCLVISATVSNAQTTLYKTYQDYLNDTGEEMDPDDLYRSSSTFGASMHFKTKSGESVKYKMKEFWGFHYKGKLFRSVFDNDMQDNIVMVADTGKIVFYVNGNVGYKMLKYNKESQTYDPRLEGVECYVSADLNSKVFFMPWNSYDGSMFANYRARWKTFKEQNPKHKKLYDCIGNTENSKVARQCIAEYNAGPDE